MLLLTSKPQIIDHLTRIKASSGFDCINSLHSLFAPTTQIGAGGGVETHGRGAPHAGRNTETPFVAPCGRCSFCWDARGRLAGRRPRTSPTGRHRVPSMTSRRLSTLGSPEPAILVALNARAATGTPPPLVLLVDDNEDARLMYSICLTYAGFACITAQDGQEAIERISERRPALVLMDATMPGMDGWEATLRIKAEPLTRDIPIYMLTAHAFAEHRRHAVEVGADGFLTKPMLPDDLVREVRRALKLPEAPIAADISATTRSGIA